LRYFEPISEKNRIHSDRVFMPLRATKNACAYDLFTPRIVYIPAGGTDLIWTNVKAYMQPDEVFIVNVRSSGGTKLGLMLANTVGWIDADYYNNPDNEGNIGICLWNRSSKVVIFDKGDKIAQGMFQKYLEASNCNSANDRMGGFGSTGK
jgi:dUTP pyrophosphatase